MKREKSATKTIRRKLSLMLQWVSGAEVLEMTMKYVFQ